MEIMKMRTLVAVALVALIIPFGIIQSRRGVSESRVDGQMDSENQVDKVAAAARKKTRKTTKGNFADASQPATEWETLSVSATASLPTSDIVANATSGIENATSGIENATSGIEVNGTSRSKPPKKTKKGGSSDGGCDVSIFWPQMICSHAVYKPKDCATDTIGDIRKKLLALKQADFKKKGIFEWQSPKGVFGDAQAKCDKALQKRNLRYPDSFKERQPLKDDQDFNNMKYVVQNTEWRFWDGRLPSGIPASWWDTPLQDLFTSKLERKVHMCSDESSVIQDAVVRRESVELVEKVSEQPKLELSIVPGELEQRCMVKLYWAGSGYPLKFIANCHTTLEKLKNFLREPENRPKIKEVGMVAQKPAAFDEETFKDFEKIIDSPDFKFFEQEGHMQISTTSSLMKSVWHVPGKTTGSDEAPEIQKQKHRLHNGCGLEVLIKQDENQPVTAAKDGLTDEAKVKVVERVKEENLSDGSVDLPANPAELGSEQAENFASEGVADFTPLDDDIIEVMDDESKDPADEPDSSED